MTDRISRRGMLQTFGATALLASRPRASIAQPRRHFWPGARLGIAAQLPGFMYPYAGNPYQLHALDDNWSVVVSERPSIDEAHDSTIWDRLKYAPRDHLIKTLGGPNGLEMRLFARLAFVGEDMHDFGARTLVVRKGDWFGQISMLIQPPSDGRFTTGERDRRDALTNAIFNALVVRGPVSMEDFLSEHGLEMELSNLNPCHFASHLMLGLDAPASPHESYFGGTNHIAMNGPPILIPFASRNPTSRERAERIAFLAGNAQFWRSNNGIRWYREDGLDTWSGEKTLSLVGFGSDRWLSFDAQADRSNLDKVVAALERLALSTVLFDKSFRDWGRQT